MMGAPNSVKLGAMGMLDGARSEAQAEEVLEKCKAETVRLIQTSGKKH